LASAYLNQPEHWTLQLGLLQFRGTVPGENSEQIWGADNHDRFADVVIYFSFKNSLSKPLLMYR